MRKKIWLTALVALIVTTVMAFHSATLNKQSAVALQSHANPASSPPTSLPDHVVYGFLFRNVTRNNERNLELQARGATAKKYFALKRELNFTAEQSQLLNEIATDCEFYVRQQDKKAQLVIAEFRATLPKTGEAPPPPPELKTMWDERNAMILAARDRLRVALGSESFDRLDNFAKFRYGKNKAPVALRPVDRRPNQEQ